MRCPVCDCALKAVGNGPGWMNADQWGFVKLGDYFADGICLVDECPGKLRHNGRTYFSDDMLGRAHDEEARRMGWS